MKLIVYVRSQLTNVNSLRSSPLDVNFECQIWRGNEAVEIPTIEVDFAKTHAKSFTTTGGMNDAHISVAQAYCLNLTYISLPVWPSHGQSH